MQEGATSWSDKSHADGVFDWAQSGQSGDWGNPNKPYRDSQKDIPMHCLPTIREAWIAGYKRGYTYMSLKTAQLLVLTSDKALEIGCKV